VIREIKRQATPGVPMLFVFLAAIIALVYGLVQSARSDNGALAGLMILCILLTFFLSAGLFAVHPNEGKVLTLFGKYVGSVREPGLWWVNPFIVKKRISLRVRNFETGKLKVNDSNSNPIEIAAVVVWKVQNTAEALFDVEDFEHYVETQTESGLRHMAASHPYDLSGDDEEGISLRGSSDVVNDELEKELSERLSLAGIRVLEVRLAHLAYSPEIAGAMLQRQQADAIIAARTRIVDGAVGMVQMALTRLKEDDVVELDEERKAAMVSNLLTVLCSERGTTPVVNTGTLHN
jgi:regulator of protease activity HflC (stomatin/prohibitin superfamily)